MTTLTKQLTTVFATNFLLYYKSHVAHVNTVGREFYSDHKLLESIYSDAQESIDTYAEYLRTLEADMPDALVDVISMSEIGDGLGPRTSKAYLRAVYDDIETLINYLTELYTTAEAEGEFGLSGFVQDRLTQHKKQCWMLRSSME